MTLTHVCIKEGNRWRRITEEEAEREYPCGTVSAWEGIFKCELCGQNVIFTADSDYKRRYFKHSRGDLVKDCPERLEQSSQSSDPLEFKAGVYDLPLRIRICSDTHFRLELGFLQVPISLLRNERKIRIRSFDSSWGEYVHSTSKIEGDKITYLSVGNIPQDIYCLSIIPNDSRLSQYWPNSVEGIDPDTDGTLFYNHKGVGKKLPKNSDVVVGHKYILLTQDSSYRDQKYRNINIELICQSHVKDSFWYAYEVTAIALDDSTRRFFAKFGCYLTEDAVTFTPLWPAYIKGPSLFKHCSEEMTFFIREGAFPKIYPEELYAPLQTELCDSGKVFTINCNEGRQILSAGRTTVLLYSQIWNDPLDQTTPLPKIKVTDLDFREIPSGEHTSLPLKKTLVVTTPFDGHIVVKKHNTVIEKRLIKSNQDNQEIELDKLQHGHSVEIFQGLDLVWSASYIKTVSDSKSSDSQLLKKLEHCDKPEIDVPYSLGSIVKRMAAYPKTKLWLYKHIRNGKMSQRAYKILISYFARKQERK